MPHHKTLYDNLSDGFVTLRERFVEKREPHPEPPSFHNVAVVNFIDPSSFSTLSSGSGEAPEKLYEKIAFRLDRDYNLQLDQVPYQHFRSNAAGTLEKISLYPVLSQGSLVSNAPSELPLPWLEGRSVENVPGEWHHLPYCHVYVATCSSADQYRTKLKPALDAFVRQLSAQNAASNYVIVYVPTGSPPEPEEESKAATRVTAAFSRFAEARKRISSVTTTTDDDDPPSEALTLVSAHLSKPDRDVARRLAADFASVCVLTLDQDDHKAEWTAFLKALASGIASGFTERCRKYDEELRAMDALRAKKKGFDLKQFFLVKESFAITYEQMHLPSEALLQYNELRAFLPDVKKQHETKAPTADVSQIALSGDVLRFRTELASMDEIETNAGTVEQYLFAREVLLLFKIADPDQILQRCLVFVEIMLAYMQREKMDEAEAAQKLAEAEKWAFQLCWDVRRASEHFFRVDKAEKDTETGEYKASDVSFTVHLCELMMFARLRLLKAKSLLALGDNVYGAEWPGMPKDLLEPWSEYKAPDEIPAETDEVVTRSNDSSFLKDSLVTEADFESHYVSFLKMISKLHKFCGRERTSARLEAELVDVYLRTGNLRKAASVSRAVAYSCAKDQWSACHFLYLFRLSGFLRQIEPPKEYLNTLVHCFTKLTSEAAPTKAMKVLQKDMLAVVQHDDVVGTNIFSSSMFHPRLNVKDMPTSIAPGPDGLLKMLFTVGDSVTVELMVDSFLPDAVELKSVGVALMPFQAYISAIEDSTPLDIREFSIVLTQKDVVLKPGENKLELHWTPMVSGQFILVSTMFQMDGVLFHYEAKAKQRHLTRLDVVPCEPTQSVSVKPLFLVPGHQQPVRVTFMAGSDVIKEGSVKLACSPGLLLLPPGEEDESKWIGSCDVPLPPCAPGETVELVAQVKSVGDEEEKVDNAHTLHAQVHTSYQYKFAEGTDALELSAGDACTAHVMDAVIPSLGNRALSIESVDCHVYAINRRLLSLAVTAHTLVPFQIKDWKLELPNHLSLLPQGDLNDSLRGSHVVADEVTSFGFDCVLEAKDGSEALSNEASLLVTLEDDYGTTYPELLPVKIPMKSIPKLSTKDIKTVLVSLETSSKAGSVGGSVAFTYSVDLSSTRNLEGALVYTIDVNHPDWILSGDVEGLLPEDGKVTVHGVPVRPGHLDRFPEFQVHLTDQATNATLTTYLAERDAFDASSSLRYTAVAFLEEASKKKKKIKIKL